MKNVLFVVIVLSLPLATLGNTVSVVKMSEAALSKEAANWDYKDTLRRVDVLNEMAFRFRNNQSIRDTVLSWISESYKLSHLISYKKGQGDAKVRLGLIYKKIGENKKAIQSYKDALRIRLYELKDSSGASNVCNNLGNLYKSYEDSLRRSLYYYRKGLQLLAHSASDRSRARLMNSLGWVLTATGKYHEGGLYLDTAYMLRIKLSDTLGLANTMLNQGARFQLIKNYVKAKDLILQAFEFFSLKKDRSGIAKCLNQLGINALSSESYPEALGFFDEALIFRNDLENRDIGAIIKNKGLTLMQMGHFDEARRNFDEGKELLQQAKDHYRLATLEFDYGSLWYDQGEFAFSIPHYRACLDYLRAFENPFLESQAFFFLSAAYTAMSEPDSALRYSSEYAEIRDSLFEEFQRTLNYEANLRETEAKIYKLERDKEAYEHQRSRIIGYIGIGVMWIFLGVAIMAYYLSRQRRRLAEQRERLSQQEVLEVMREKQLETHYAWIDGIETARKKIGQDLHDSIGSLLSMIKLYFSSVEEKIDTIQEENRKQYDKANQLLDEACQKVRSISHEMTSAILVKFGLRAQLEALVEALEGTDQLGVELTVHGLKKRLDNALAFPIYSMIQEMVNNVIKHAKATKVSIELNEFDDMINVIVTDNGVGFDVTEVERKGGIGLKNLKSRVHQLEGQLNIDSQPNKGTSISIDIPTYKNKFLTLKEEEDGTAN